LTFRFRGVDLIACLSGALVFPALRTLAVADLHLEKGSRWARRGRLLPPYDSRATLTALAETIGIHAPSRVVCLGDSFDDSSGGARLAKDDVSRLHGLMAGREWIWVAGNHDPTPSGLGGAHASEVALGPFILRHSAAPEPATGEISGHYHPKASVAVAGRRYSARCFACSDRRLVLPAFGAFTGGLDVFSPALAALLGRDFRVHLLGPTQVHAFPAGRLIGAAGTPSPTLGS